MQRAIPLQKRYALMVRLNAGMHREFLRMGADEAPAG